MTKTQKNFFIGLYIILLIQIVLDIFLARNVPGIFIQIICKIFCAICVLCTIIIGIVLLSNYDSKGKMKAELLEHLINIEQIKTVFARNLFPRPCQDYKKHFKKYYKNKLVFSDSESMLLYLVFDNLHNIPELIKVLVKCENFANINVFPFSLVLNCLKDLYKLINKENYRKTLKINESKNVSIWISLLRNIKREISAIQKLFNLDENNNYLDISSLNDYLTEIFKSKLGV